MLKNAILTLFFTLPLCMQAQNISSIRTRSMDTFVEWDLFQFAEEEEPDSTIVLTEEELEEAAQEEETNDVKEEFAGFMRLRWVHKEDWKDWEYEFGSERGSIRQKWDNDPTQWELRNYNGDIVTMRQLWPNDQSQWTVTDNEHSFTFRSKWANMGDEWITSGSDQYGSFYLYTLFEGDPRDWAIDDKLIEEISPGIRMAFVFLATFVTSPKL